MTPIGFPSTLLSGVLFVLGDVLANDGLAGLKGAPAQAVIRLELHANELVRAPADDVPEHELVLVRIVQDDRTGLGVDALHRHAQGLLEQLVEMGAG